MADFRARINQYRSGVEPDDDERRRRREAGIPETTDFGSRVRQYQETRVRQEPRIEEPKPEEPKKEGFFSRAGKAVGRFGVQVAGQLSSAFEEAFNFAAREVPEIATKAAQVLFRPLKSAEQRAWEDRIVNDYQRHFDEMKKSGELTVEIADGVRVPFLPNILPKVTEKVGEGEAALRPAWYDDWSNAPLREKLGSRFWQTVEELGTNVGSSLATVLLTRKVSGSMLTGTSVLGLSTARDVSQGARDNGVDEQTANYIGMAVAVPVTILEKFGYEQLLGRGVIKNWGLSFFNKVLGRKLGSVGSRVLTSGAVETLTEITQEEVQMAAEQSFREVGVDERKTRDVMAGLGGVLSGLFIGGSSEVLNQRHVSTDEKQKTSTLEYKGYGVRVQPGLEQYATGVSIVEDTQGVLKNINGTGLDALAKVQGDTIYVAPEVTADTSSVVNQKSAEYYINHELAHRYYRENIAGTDTEKAFTRLYNRFMQTIPIEQKAIYQATFYRPEEMFVRVMVGNKSVSEPIDEFVHGIVGKPSFDVPDIQSFNPNISPLKAEGTELNINQEPPSKARDNVKNAVPVAAGQTDNTEGIIGEGDRVQSFEQSAAKTVFENVIDGNKGQRVQLQTVKYDDGRVAYSVKADTDTTSLNVPFADLFPNEQTAIQAGVDAILDFTQEQRQAGVPVETQSQLTKIENEVGRYLRQGKVQTAREFSGKAYRADTGFRAGGSAMDVINFEADDLGNEHVRQQAVVAAKVVGVDLADVPARSVMWVTRTREQASRFGDQVRELEFAPGSVALVDLGDDGVLVLPKEAIDEAREPRKSEKEEKTTVAKKKQGIDDGVRETLENIRAAGFGDAINEDGTLTLYHKTTKSAARNIERVGFRDGAFFAASRDAAQELASTNKKGEAEIIEIKAEPSAIFFNQGTGEFEARGVLVKNDDGVYALAEQKESKEQEGGEETIRAVERMQRRESAKRPSAKISTAFVSEPVMVSLTMAGAAIPSETNLNDIKAGDWKKALIESRGYVLDPSNGSMLPKVGRKGGGIDTGTIESKEELTAGYHNGILTDAYMLIRDEKIARDFFDAYFDKKAKRAAKSDPNQKEAYANVKKSLIEKARDLIGSFPDVDAIIPKAPGSPARIQGYYSDASTGITAVLTDGKKQVAVNADKLAFIRDALPDADMQVTGAVEAVQFRVGDEVKALLMPVNTDGKFPFDAKTTKIKVVRKAADNAGSGVFIEGNEIELGGMGEVRPIEFPELVVLARELIGNDSVVKRFRRVPTGEIDAKTGKPVTAPTKLGYFSGKDKNITLDISVFEKGNEEQLAKVMSHELGHMIDFLPDETLKRGNMLGHLMTLQSHLKNTYGESEVANKTLRDELWNLSTYWRPIGNGATNKTYMEYRKKSKELYADAISVLFNSPGTLQRMAPTFYDGFFGSLDRKPEVKEAYFDLQSLLAGDREGIVARRRAGIKEMFEQGDMAARDLQEQRIREREERSKHLFSRFKHEVVSLNYSMIERVNKLRKGGEFINQDDNPVYALEERNYLGGKIKSLFEQHFQPVYETLSENNIDWHLFGEYLFTKRIVDGDRSEVANPRGITPDAAQEILDTMKGEVGDERFALIEQQASSFRGGMRSIAEEAFKEGLYSDELYAEMQKNPSYVTFQVIEHIEQGVTAKVYRQIGTLKDVTNPANASLLKMIETVKAIERNRVTKSVVKFLQQHYPKDIKKATMRFTGKALTPVESRLPNEELVRYYEDGKLVGFYVDPYIKQTIDRNTVGQNNVFIGGIRFLNGRLFRPLFITFNLGFQSFNVIRDFTRFWKNVPNMSLYRAAKLYVRALPAAKARAFGVSDKSGSRVLAGMETVKRMEREQVLSFTLNDMLLGQSLEDKQIEAIMQRVGVSKETKTEERAKIIRPVFKLLEFIKNLGDMIETIPKVAGFYELVVDAESAGRTSKFTPKEARSFIRRKVGSPDFLDKGHITPATNELFLFSNAIIQGIRSDIEVATDPRTRAGFMWKTAMRSIAPKILMYAALYGLFGDKMKELMRDATEYDKTNYSIIPLGQDPESRKTIYLRIPDDETGRLIGGVFWKALTMFSNDRSFGKDLADVVSYTGGQIPSISPVLEGLAATQQFLSGQNPYDFFHGRNILTDDQYQAGGWTAAKPFLLWQFNQFGGSVFTRFYTGETAPKDQSTAEKFLQTPVLSNVIGRFIRVTDYGELELYRQVLDAENTDDARRRITENRLVNDYIAKWQEGDKSEDATKNAVKELWREVIGTVDKKHMEDTEKTKATNLERKFRIGIARGMNDPKISALIDANTNKQKIELLTGMREVMNEEDFNLLLKQAKEYKVISDDVIKALK